MTLERAYEIALQIREGQRPPLWTDQQEAMDALIGASKIAEQLMAKHEVINDLIESLQVDSSAGVDEQAQSCMVIGNVNVETLLALGFDIPKTKGQGQ